MPNMLDLDARFSQQPQTNIPRSIVPRKSDVKTTFDFGYLVPIYLDEVLPGQSSKMSLGSLVRMGTPKFPVMDSAYMDFYAFFVPNRLVWNHWEEFMGENKDSAWVSDIEYSIPGIATDDLQFVEGSVGDYFGLPVGTLYQDGYFISALPFRGYNLIWNEWFRDQNYQNPVPVNIGDDDEENTYNLMPVNKLHDIFTSVTPEPQKGSSVSLTFNGGLAPIYAVNQSNMPISDGDWIERAKQINGGSFPTMEYIKNQTGSASIYNMNYGPSTNISGTSGYSAGQINALSVSTTSAATGANGVINNLVADLNFASISTINQLRNAIVVQQYLETMARGGSRYTEILRSLFGVISPDARLQRPELLGHIRLDINMQQVVQTSFIGGDTSYQTPLGSTGAMSKTTGYNFFYDKSFVEHGYVFIVACARTELSYQQGIERHFRRKSVTDFYNPIFANIGNQPITYDRIYADGNETLDSEVFGYQEAWAEYRFKPNRVCGKFRSNVDGSLDAWHYAEYFTDRPIMSEDFLNASYNEVYRTLVVDEPNQQLLCNFFFDEVATLPMPVYSIPGLDVL